MKVNLVGLQELQGAEDSGKEFKSDTFLSALVALNHLSDQGNRLLDEVVLEDSRDAQEEVGIGKIEGALSANHGRIENMIVVVIGLEQAVQQLRVLTSTAKLAGDRLRAQIL